MAIKRIHSALQPYGKRVNVTIAWCAFHFTDSIPYWATASCRSAAYRIPRNLQSHGVCRNARLPTRAMSDCRWVISHN